MGGVHGGHEVFENHAVRGVPVHADLLIDDALLLADAFLGEIGSGYKLQQQPQAVFKVLGAGEVVGGHVVAGEGIHIGPQSGKLRRHIPVPGQIEHLVFQKMGHAGRGGVGRSLKGKIRVDGAVVRDEIGKLLAEALPGHHGHLQAVGQPLPADGFIQPGIEFCGHWVSPFRK